MGKYGPNNLEDKLRCPIIFIIRRTLFAQFCPTPKIKNKSRQPVAFLQHSLLFSCMLKNAYEFQNKVVDTTLYVDYDN